MERWQHVKTGGEYEVVCSGRLEAEGKDGVKYIVYRSLMDDKIWIRPASEFFDGRFELLNDAVPAIEKNAEESFEKCFKEGGYQYSKDNKDNARGWYVDGWNDCESEARRLLRELVEAASVIEPDDELTRALDADRAYLGDDA
jgi:hypothetical protein